MTPDHALPPGHRILVTGASGTGTTTLGRAVAAGLGLPHLDVDDYHWLPSEPPFLRPRPRPQRSARLRADLQRAQLGWVMSGSVQGWGVEFEDAFTLIVFLQLPLSLRLRRLHEREQRTRGGIRPEFLAWAAAYDTDNASTRSLAGQQRWLAERRCAVLTLDGDMSNDDRVARVLAALARR